MRNNHFGQKLGCFFSSKVKSKKACRLVTLCFSRYFNVENKRSSKTRCHRCASIKMDQDFYTITILLDNTVKYFHPELSVYESKFDSQCLISWSNENVYTKSMRVARLALRVESHFWRLSVGDPRVKSG